MKVEIISTSDSEAKAKKENELIDTLLIKNLQKNNKTLALAESCTGGLISDRVTNISGASHVFCGGVVCYSNKLKNKILNVSSDVLNNNGAVSKECAQAMVTGLKNITGADYCVAVTGIAGPTGGNKTNPVGTVFIATCFLDKTNVIKYHFSCSRIMFKQIVSTVVIKKILDHLVSS